MLNVKFMLRFLVGFGVGCVFFVCLVGFFISSNLLGDKSL